MEFELYKKKLKVHLETSLTMNLDRTVGVEFESPEPFSETDADSLFPEGPAIISIPMGADHKWHFLVQKQFAAALAGIQDKIDGDYQYDSSTHDIALGDSLQIAFASIETDLADLLQTSVEIGDPEVGIPIEELIEGLLDLPSVIWRFNIENWGEGLILNVLESESRDVFNDDASSTPSESVSTALSEDEISAMMAQAGMAENSKTQAPESEPSLESPGVGVPPPDTNAPRQESPVISTPSFEDFGEPTQFSASSPSPNLDMLMEVTLPITIELGRAKMLVKEILDLGVGSVIELEKLSGEPVDIFVNDKMFARGEVVVIEENFGVRITELLKVGERLNALK